MTSDPRLNSGALFKLPYHVWNSASLREAAFDTEGFYLKVDGSRKGETTEQLYLHFRIRDVLQTIERWGKEVKHNGTEADRRELEAIMIEIGKT